MFDGGSYEIRFQIKNVARFPASTHPSSHFDVTVRDIARKMQKTEKCDAVKSSCLNGDRSFSIFFDLDENWRKLRLVWRSEIFALLHHVFPQIP